jgi:sulfite reductase (NADPH) flavoprotein alpha-component
MAYDKNNPFPAKLKARTRLTAPESGKDVRHLVFDIGGSEMAYKCGDSIAVFPKNDIVEVAEILDLLKIQPDTEVELSFSKRKVPIFTALHEHLCVKNLSRQFLEWFVSSMDGADEISYVDEKMLCSDRECQITAQSHSLLEILRKFKSLRKINGEDLVPRLRRLTPRLYSIASSPLETPNEVHIVVNVVNYVNFLGNERRGVASTYLANDMNIGVDRARVFIVNSMFALPPEADASMVMVGPGTGVAPFRGFLRERKLQMDRGEVIGRNWLFFGDRNYATDFLFKDEFLEFKELGVLTNLHLAFSRDQEKKIYVQDRIWENREELWSWILDGAYVYVCGEAARMAIDVENTLRRIAVEVGNFDEVRADEFFKLLKKNRHYQKDVY